MHRCGDTAAWQYYFTRNLKLHVYYPSLKKEEFYLNRKRVQKSEVMSLLESAGFSKSNPYYIVQQGKVANLCVMKDKDRLNLLKEVAGTTVYEERRAESVKIMLDTANKKEKVEVQPFLTGPSSTYVEFGHLNEICDRNFTDSH